MGDPALALIKTEIASGRATIRSLGVLYAVAMMRPPAGREWSPINLAIGAWFGGPFSDQMRKLDKVKKIGHEIYQAALDRLLADEKAAA